VEVKQDNFSPANQAAVAAHTRQHEPIEADLSAARATPVLAVGKGLPKPPVPVSGEVEPVPPPPAETPAEDPAAAEDEAAGQSNAGTGGIGDPAVESINTAQPSDGSTAGAPGGTGTVVVTVGGPGSTPPSTPPPPAAEPPPPAVEAPPLPDPGTSTTNEVAPGDSVGNLSASL
jgi:hypothetical protein